MAAHQPIASLQLLVYDATAVAVHAQTIRATYTIPTGFWGEIECSFIWLNRATNTGGTSTARAFARRLNGSTSYPFNGVALTGLTVPAAVHSAVGNSGLVSAGDNVDLTTRDPNADGTVDYSSSTVVRVTARPR